MSIDRATRLLFDSSCWVAAAGSVHGGSAFLFIVVAQGYLQAVVSQPILVEAQRNVREQLRPEAYPRYVELAAVTPMHMVALPARELHQVYATVVGDKDEHVLAAAVVGQAEFLITLDKPLAQRVNEADAGIHALSPGEFITTELVNHPDYIAMR